MVIFLSLSLSLSLIISFSYSLSLLISLLPSFFYSPTFPLFSLSLSFSLYLPSSYFMFLSLSLSLSLPLTISITHSRTPQTIYAFCISSSSPGSCGEILCARSISFFVRLFVITHSQLEQSQLLQSIKKIIHF